TVAFAPRWLLVKSAAARLIQESADTSASLLELWDAETLTAARNVASASEGETGFTVNGRRTAAMTEAVGESPRRVNRARNCCLALDSRLSTVPIGQPSRWATSS